MDVAKLRLQVSYQFMSKLDGTVWLAGAHGFDRASDLATSVLGIGTLTPTELAHADWCEYGVRVGYDISDASTLDIFANGVSGEPVTETRVHAGAALRVHF